MSYWFYLNRLEQIASRALDLIYPRSAVCPLCSQYKCDCMQAVLARYASREACRRCGKFLPKAGECADCRSRGPGFPDRVFALAPYEGPMREALHRFKYAGDIRSGKFLGRLLAEGPGREVEKPDLIVPVPLHPRKKRERGYNQALVLAREAACLLQADVDEGLLTRVVFTQAMASLTRDARALNLVEALAIREGHRVKGKKVLLVDDIITTGATLEACGTLLRNQGAARLYALCVASGKC